MVLIAFSILTIQNTNAQKNPMEVLVGDKATNVLFTSIKKVAENSKFGYFTIVNLNMPYDKTELFYKKYHMIQANASYEIFKNIKVFAGAFSNNNDYGASAGILGTFPFKNSFLMVSNRNSIVFHSTSEFLVIYEYRPKLSEKIRLYSRIQLMAETNYKEFKRGYQMLRLGITTNQFSYGLAATFDQFGNVPFTYENTGLFIRAEL